jgi:hypothetical protein
MSTQHDSSVQEHFSKLQQFRQAAYEQLGTARDALFELQDAVLQTAHLQSFVELSCAPAFRRKWSSTYEALQDGRPNRAELLKLYLTLLPPAERRLLAVDHTAWPRLWAETLLERSYQHQPSAIPGHSPVTIGQGYSTVVGVPEVSGSWALPLLHEQFTDQKPIQTGAAQLKQVCLRLEERPLILADCEYGCAQFLLATKEVKADKLMRLRANTVLEGATRPYKGHGPKPIHGIPFRFKDPTTWGPPEAITTGTSERFGPFTVRTWSGLRFAKALDMPLHVACIEHPQAPATRRFPKLTWFGWQGEPPPTQWWRYYNRRFCVDHWYRFAKGRLHWLLPKVATAQQGQCWSDLMPLLTWELWLARPLVPDKPLPWQKPQGTLTPGRVCQGMPALLPLLGTPTRACKPRGVAPGWPTGRPRTRRKRCELVRSARWQAIRAKKKAQARDSPPKRGRPKRNPPPLPA